MSETPNLAETIASFAARLRPRDIPREVIARAKLHILDSFGVALAAARTDFADTMVRTAQSLGGEGEYPLIGRGERLSLRDAVQVNAALVHCLDFDDTHGASVVHVSATALPVALAMSIAHGRSGADLLAAYVLSVETAALVGSMTGGAFHKRGFHPTGLVNAFGAAVASSWLQGLDRAQIACAQGIVLSFASGSLEFLDSGAWTKRVHPGWAGVAGVTAAALASKGLESPPRPYEGRNGLFALYTLPGTKADMGGGAALGRDWQMMNVGIKPLPACHFTHAFSDAALDIANTHRPAARDIAEIVLRVPVGIVDVVCEPEQRKLRPLNSYEAQFSLHYIVAATLVRGRFTLAEIETDAIIDAEILNLTDRVCYEIDPEAEYPRYFPGEVAVKMADGRVFKARHPHHRGSDANPLSAADVVAKFEANAGAILDADGIARLRRAVDGLDGASGAGELVEAFAAPAVAQPLRIGKQA